MLYSMTGYGRATAEISDKKITVEIKSLNSKQLDLTVRLPHHFRDAENSIRGLVTNTLQRGKVEVCVSVDTIADSTAIDFNLPILKAYKEQITHISESLEIPLPSDWYAVLFRFPDTMRADSNNTADDKEIKGLIEATVKALEALVSYRRTEGVKLEEFFETRIDAIRMLLDKVPAYENERIEKIRERIEDNLSKLPSVEYDKGRFEQEMIFYIEKLDINEEKQRLDQHLHYFIDTMKGQEGGQGKKLGFIAQEMGREINTLGSKSNHAEMQIIVVDMKDNLEQIKEQVLNVM